VIRLRDEFHNCWDRIIPAVPVRGFRRGNGKRHHGIANSISVTPVNPALVTSKAMRLLDGIVTLANRIDDNVIAFYQFKEGSGTTAFDTSGVSPDMHLTLSGGVSWVGGWGIDITSGRHRPPPVAAAKHDLITATGEYSVEAWWCRPMSRRTGAHRQLLAGTTARNFTLGQTMYSYDFLQRSSSTDANGEPALLRLRRTKSAGHAATCGADL
jgi:hypothetical protein